MAWLTAVGRHSESKDELRQHTPCACRFADQKPHKDVEYQAGHDRLLVPDGAITHKVLPESPQQATVLIVSD